MTARENELAGLTGVEDRSAGGPAFPILNPLFKSHLGMTLLDYFAAQAMQSLLLLGMRPPRHGESTDNPEQPWYFGYWETKEKGAVGVEALAADAYQVAAAMLAERQKRRTP